METKIAYVTDIHLDETPEELRVATHKNWETILKDISARGIKHIIIGGDIGKSNTHQPFFESLKGYKIDITLGNHDSYSTVMQHYTHETSSSKQELYYSYDLGSYKLLFLDSSADMISKEQLNWLKEEISTPKNMLLFIHHSILPLNAEVDKRFALKNRANIKSMLANLKNEVTVFSGHYHFNHETSSKNIRQIITPACSFQVEKIPNELKTNADTFGYRILNLNKDSIQTELVLFES
jgi:Icc protein